MPLLEQLANVGSDVARVHRWKEMNAEVTWPTLIDISTILPLQLGLTSKNRR